MCFNEFFGSVIDIISFIFFLIDFLCCLCGSGLEEYIIVRVFKIFIGIEFIKDEEYVNV